MFIVKGLNFGIIKILSNFDDEVINKQINQVEGLLVVVIGFIVVVVVVVVVIVVIVGYMIKYIKKQVFIIFIKCGYEMLLFNDELCLCLIFV